MAKSKPKGNRYERRVAKLLSEITGEAFRRTPASGGFNKTGGVVIQEGVFSGDVICDRNGFLFNVEAKNHEEFSFVSILTKHKQSKYIKWWRQSVQDAIAHGLHPMLMFKPNRGSDFVAITGDGISRVNPELFMIPHFIIHIREPINPDDPISGILPDCYVFHWKDFAEKIKPANMFRSGSTKWDVDVVKKEN